jgi:hypothetical protein
VDTRCSAAGDSSLSPFLALIAQKSRSLFTDISATERPHSYDNLTLVGPRSGLMRRREFVALLGSATAIFSLAVSALAAMSYMSPLLGAERT